MIPTVEQIKPLISRRTRATITALAIVLNLLIISFFLFTQLNLDDTSLIRHLQKIRTVLKKKNPKEEWAALNPKTSTLGAPVILAQAPPTLTKATPNRPADKQPNQSQSTTQQTMPQSNNVAQNTIATTTEKNNDSVSHEKSEMVENTKELKIDEPTQLVQDIKANAKSEIKEQNQPKSTSFEQAIKAALTKKLKDSASLQATGPAILQAQGEQSKNKQEKRTIMKTQNNAQLTQTQAQKLTFAQLVKGFTEHLKHEGEYTISMQGKSGAKATEDQLRVGRFLQKIIQCMQTSWKINRNRYPLNHRVLADIAIRVVINKDGTLNNLIIQKTSGRQIIDNFVLDILKDASKSFPPIPHYLNQEVCVITCNWEKIPLPEGPTGYTITH